MSARPALPTAEEIGTLVPIGRIAKDTPYSADFLRQLARSGKLRAYKLNRDWMTTPDAVRDYLKSQTKRHEKALSLLQAAEKAFLSVALLVIVFSATPQARAQGLSNPPPSTTSAILDNLVAGWQQFTAFFGQEFSVVGAKTNQALLSFGQALLGKTTEEYLADAPAPRLAFVKSPIEPRGVPATAPTSVAAEASPQVLGISTSQSSSAPENKQVTSTLQIQALIAQTLQTMLAQGLLTGPKGDRGDTGLTPGFSGPNGMAQNGNGQTTSVVGGTPIVTYIPPVQQSGFSGASLAGFTGLSAQSFSTQNAAISGNLNVSGPTAVTSLTASGNLSVGGSFSAVTSTLSALTVSGPATFSGSTTIAGLTVTGFNPGLTLGSVAFQGVSGLSQDNSNFFYDSISHRFGLGTTTPGQLLTVSGNALFTGNATTSGNQVVSGALTVSGASSLQSTLAVTAMSTLATVTATTLTTTGNVGIGTTTPSFPLDVQGIIDVYGTYDLNGQTFIISSSSLANTFIGFGAGNSTATGTENTAVGYQAGTALTNVGNAAPFQNLGQNSFFGYRAGYSCTNCTESTLIGFQAGVNLIGNNATSGENGIETFIGAHAGESETATGPGTGNVFVGQKSGLNMNGADDNANAFLGTHSGTVFTSGRDNIILGNAADGGSPDTSGSDNILMSQFTGEGGGVLTGNIMMGNGAGKHLANSTNNILIGMAAGSQATTGTGLTILGYSAGYTATSSSDNTFIGYFTGDNVISGQNTFIGSKTGYNGNGTIQGGGNIMLGYATGANLTAGSNDILIGNNLNFNGSYYSSTSTSNEVDIGNTLFANTAADSVTILPGAAGWGLGIGTTTPDAPLDVYGNVNIEKGNYYLYNSLPAITASTTLNNYFFGGAGQLADTGSNITAVGFNAMNAIDSGGNNTAVGEVALQSNTSGAYNTALGQQALASQTTPNYNTAVGQAALYNITTAAQNTAIGGLAGTYVGGGFAANSTSSNSVYVGYLSRPLSSGDTNEIVIGANSTGIGSNTVELGNGSVITTQLQGNVGIGTSTPTLGPLTMASGAFVSSGGTWTNASDRNLKENFTTLTPASILEKIDQLPVTQWDYKSEGPTVNHIGPVAQDFWAAFHLGNSSTSISTIDPAGVALLGIQALDQKLQALQGSLTGNANTTGELTVYNPGNFSGDSVGEAKILTGQASVRVTFSQAYQYQPIVTVTAVDFPTYGYVSDVDATGFTVNLPTSVASDVIFDWHSFASPGAQLTVSDGRTQPIALVVATSSERSASSIISPEPATESTGTPEALGTSISTSDSASTGGEPSTPASASSPSSTPTADLGVMQSSEQPSNGQDSTATTTATLQNPSALTEVQPAATTTP